MVTTAFTFQLSSLADNSLDIRLRVTVKPLYGHQQGAVLGYNPHKPGRPSHTYHTYMIANLRLVLDVEVQAGDQAQSSHSLPGLLGILNKLPAEQRPQFVRGDCDWGTDRVMSDLEDIGQDYLCKLRKSKNVKSLINKQHCLGGGRILAKVGKRNRMTYNYKVGRQADVW